MGYRWDPIFRFVPANGAPSVMVLADSFPDTGGPLRMTVDYALDQDVRTDVNRGRSVLYRGLRPTVRMEFEVFDITEQTVFATICRRLTSPDWTVQLSMDGGVVFRDVLLQRLDGPDPIAGKTVVGGKWALTVEAVDLISDYPDMNALDGALEILADGGFEEWTTATNATRWSEATGGGTVNQEATIVASGASSARLDRTSVGPGLNVTQSHAAKILPGRTYRLSVKARLGAGYGAGPYVEFRNTSKSQSWSTTAGGVWTGVGFPAAISGGAGEGAFTALSVDVRVSQSFHETDSYNVSCDHTGANGTSIYYDDASLVGPVRPSGISAW